MLCNFRKTSLIPQSFIADRFNALDVCLSLFPDFCVSVHIVFSLVRLLSGHLLGNSC